MSDQRLEPFAQVAKEEQQRAGQRGAKSDLDPTWAAPAISEAWCKAKWGLATGNLNQHSAIEIIVAIETFQDVEAKYLLRPRIGSALLVALHKMCCIGQQLVDAPLKSIGFGYGRGAYP